MRFARCGVRRCLQFRRSSRSPSELPSTRSSSLYSIHWRSVRCPFAPRIVSCGCTVDSRGQRQNLFSYPDYVEYRQAATMFDDVTAYIPASVTTQVGGEAEDVITYVVAPNYFTLLGISSPSDAFSFPLMNGQQIPRSQSSVTRCGAGVSPQTLGSSVQRSSSTTARSRLSVWVLRDSAVLSRYLPTYGSRPRCNVQFFRLAISSTIGRRLGCSSSVASS